MAAGAATPGLEGEEVAAAVGAGRLVSAPPELLARQKAGFGAHCECDEPQNPISENGRARQNV